MMIERILKNTRHSAALVVFVSFAALAVAMVSQYIFGLLPCVLCVYQRIPYVFAIAFGLISYGAARQDKQIANLLLAMAGIMFLVGMGLAGFHVGVEQGWWSGTSACGGAAADANLSLEELRLKVLSAPIIRCDEAAFSLFGISMAGYNGLLSFCLAVYSFLAVKKGLENGKKA